MAKKGRRKSVVERWSPRFVRCELDLAEDVIRCYRLRRREPAEQPLVREIPYTLPARMLGT